MAMTCDAAGSLVAWVEGLVGIVTFSVDRT